MFLVLFMQPRSLAPRRRGGPNGALPLSPRLPSPRSHLHSSPPPPVRRVIWLLHGNHGPDRSPFLQSVSSDWAPNCPNPYDGLPKRERSERRVICVRSLRTQRAEESFRAEARRAWPLLQACTLPASVGATGGALSRCTVSEEEEEEAGRGDASLITRRTDGDDYASRRQSHSPRGQSLSSNMLYPTLSLAFPNCVKLFAILFSPGWRSFPSFFSEEK